MMQTRIGRLGYVLLFAGAAAASAQDRAVGQLPSLAPLVENAAPAVVNIAVTEVIETRGGRGRRGAPPQLFQRDNDEQEEQEQLGAGSGVIVDAENGYVLTNHHVIENASRIRVTLVDNRSFEARILGSDPSTDLAVLKIEAGNLTAIPFASARDLKVGDYVVAIGNPFGIGQTVTSGIVSALGRTRGLRDGSYEDFIQTDASINPGNSGGALVNLEGGLIGINSAIISTGFGGGNVGIGFAIPAEMVVSVMDRLLEFGEVRRGFLGVRMEVVTPDFAEDYGLAATAGALVMEVIADSAAEAAGFQINDVITGVNGQPIADSNELRNRIAMMLPGESVSVQIVRGNGERSIMAVLGEPESSGDGRPSVRELAPPTPLFEGVELMAENGRDSGLRVVSNDSTDDRVRKELYPGDLITAVNRRRVSSVADARELAEGTMNVVVEVLRGSRPQLIRLR